MSGKVKGTNFNFSASCFTKVLRSLRPISDHELQYLRDSWDNVLLSVNAMSCSWEIKPEFTEKRQWRPEEISRWVVKWLQTYTDPMQAFNVGVFYKLLDVTINELELRFEGQRQVVELFKFLLKRQCWNCLTHRRRAKNRSRKPANSVYMIYCCPPMLETWKCVYSVLYIASHGLQRGTQLSKNLNG